VHPVYLARAFRRHYGTSIGGFMLQCRIRLAMRRLATSADSISQIALECAFADQAHFTRLFRREAGMPPGQFRRVARRCASAA
jgi:AraC family transcriptional regulator